MARRKLRCGGRRKAPFGSQEAAILGAAAINVAGTLAGAAMSSKAAKEAAKSQADATAKAAQTSANSIKLQTENSNKLQEQSMQFTREQNEENRQLQRDIQLNLQMLAGQQNEINRQEASKIQVRNGGSMKNKSKRKLSNISLRGNYNTTNMPFIVTDGGNVVPLGQTKEGYDLYEIQGNDHKHYHKAQGGKNKTGVGIKFPNGEVIEGEGNQNTNSGELLMVTPDDAKFISKHTVKGFNPREAVLAGMNPEQVFQIQEAIKDAYNIPDDGKSKGQAKYGTWLSARQERKFQDWWSKIAPKGSNPDNYPVDYRKYFKQPDYTTPVGRNLNSLRKIKAIGGNLNLLPTSTIDFSTDTIAPTVGGVEYIIANNPEANINNNNYGIRRSVAKNGKRVKAWGGYRFDDYDPWSKEQPRAVVKVDWANVPYLRKSAGSVNYNIPNITKLPIVASSSDLFNFKDPSTTNNNNNSKSTNRSPNKLWSVGGLAANLGAAGLGALGNYIGAAMTTRGNKKASNIIAQGYTTAGNILADAYKNMRGIDMNALRKDDYQAAHAMAAIRAPYVNNSSQLALVDRSLQRGLSQIDRGTLSAAAAMQRANQAELSAYDQRSKIYDDSNKTAEAIKQANAELITKVANENADRDIQANKDYAANYLSLLQYNNDIENEKIAGIAQAYADALTQSSDVRGQALQTNAKTWGNAISSSFGGFSTALTDAAKAVQKYNQVMVNATPQQQINEAIRLGDTRELERLKELFPANSPNLETIETRARIDAAINTINAQYDGYTSPLQRIRNLFRKRSSNNKDNVAPYLNN